MNNSKCEWSGCGALFETLEERDTHVIQNHLKFVVVAVSKVTDETDNSTSNNQSQLNETSQPVSSSFSPVQCTWGFCPFVAQNEGLMHIHVQFKHLLVPAKENPDDILPIPYKGTEVAMPKQLQVHKKRMEKGKKQYYKIIRKENVVTGEITFRFSCTICEHIVTSRSGGKHHYITQHGTDSEKEQEEITSTVDLTAPIGHNIECSPPQANCIRSVFQSDSDW